MSTLLLTVMVICLLIYVRNSITYRIQMSCLNRLMELCKEKSARGEPFEDLWKRYDELSYNRILFDLTIWTASQARPWLYARGQRPPRKPPPPNARIG